MRTILTDRHSHTHKHTETDKPRAMGKILHICLKISQVCVIQCYSKLPFIVLSVIQAPVLSPVKDSYIIFRGGQWHVAIKAMNDDRCDVTYSVTNHFVGSDSHRPVVRTSSTDAEVHAFCDGREAGRFVFEVRVRDRCGGEETRNNYSVNVADPPTTTANPRCVGNYKTCLRRQLKLLLNIDFVKE